MGREFFSITPSAASSVSNAFRVVTKTHPVGSLRVRRATGSRAVSLSAAYVLDHVELRYATTAHRAQGRAVDTAHAYVTATTTREPLYVMATRGRESNRLYVDTAYDPDLATAHNDIEPTDPADVLRAVLARPGADASATATRVAEQAAASRPSRLAAKGAAALDARREERYLGILRAAGADAEIELARKTDRMRPLFARMHHAERLGIDLVTPEDLSRTCRSLPQHEAAELLPAYESQLVSEMSRLGQRSQWAAFVRDPARHHMEVTRP